MTYALKPTSTPPFRPVTEGGLSPQAALEDFRRRLVRFALKLIWNREDAEDVVQDAFKIAVEKGPNMGEASFGPWMFRTVGNLCLNLRRRRREAPLADWIDPPHGETPEAEALAAERLGVLRDAIGELPDQQRLALVLRAMEGLEYADIAEVMGLSVSAVRTHVHLARARLAELLGDEAQRRTRE